MKYSAVILAFVAAVAAQSVSELVAAIPACAKPALDETATSVGCEVTDYACQCGPKKQELVVAASPKVVEACGTEAAAVLEATNALCEFVEANPDAAGGKSSSAAAETSSAAAETTSAPSETSAATTTTGSSSGVQASVSSAVESVSSEASSKIAEFTSKASSAAAAATSAVAPNAAGINAVNMGAMLGAAGVVAAMI